MAYLSMQIPGLVALVAQEAAGETPRPEALVVAAVRPVAVPAAQPLLAALLLAAQRKPGEPPVPEAQLARAVQRKPEAWSALAEQQVPGAQLVREA
jgi:hypothetical protein